MSAREFATFRVGGSLFALDVRAIQEINRAVDITPVPLAPALVRGLVDVRGHIVTVLDPAVLFGLPQRATTRDSANIILKPEAGGPVPGEDARSALLNVDDSVGLLVDSIEDVLAVPSEQIEPPPGNVQDRYGRLLAGVLAPEEGDLAMILDPACLLEASLGDL